MLQAQALDQGACLNALGHVLRGGLTPRSLDAPRPASADDDRLHPSGGVGGRCADVRDRVRSVANAQPTRALR